MGDLRKNHALDAFLRAIDDGENGAERDLRRSSHALLVEGRVVAGRYRLGPRIARGGMATIWDAFDESLGRAVALKFMSPSYIEDEEYRVRFEEEARAAARLATPHVAAIYDHGLEDGVPYIVMERLYGRDLEARLHAHAAQGGRVSLPFAAKLATEVGRALKAAHAAGIIHRDLKPKNVFVCEGEDGETIKLLDFGVAKHAGTARVLTATGVMLGSPFYMSPEQIRCERDLDGRTDLWSLGTILYRAITGVKPFDGEMTAILYKIARESPPPPSSIVSSLPRSVDAFFERALARPRGDRFQTATELAAAFREAVGSVESDPSAARVPAPVDVCTPANDAEEATEAVPLAEMQLLAAPRSVARSGLRLSLRREEALAAVGDPNLRRAEERDVEALPAVLGTPPRPEPERPDPSAEKLDQQRKDAIRSLQRLGSAEPVARVGGRRGALVVAAVALLIALVVLLVLVVVVKPRAPF